MKGVSLSGDENRIFLSDDLFESSDKGKIPKKVPFLSDDKNARRPKSRAKMAMSDARCARTLLWSVTLISVSASGWAWPFPACADSTRGHFPTIFLRLPTADPRADRLQSSEEPKSLSLFSLCGLISRTAPIFTEPSGLTLVFRSQQHTLLTTTRSRSKICRNNPPFTSYEDLKITHCVHWTSICTIRARNSLRPTH